MKCGEFLEWRLKREVSACSCDCKNDDLENVNNTNKALIATE